MKRYLAYLPAALLAFAPSCVQATTEAPIHLQAYRSLLRIASPQFSPDGTRIAFLTIKPDFVHDRYDTTLRVVATDGNAPKALVRGMHDLKMPRWSPDGRTLAFIAKVGKQKAEIYTIPASGGTPRRISDARNGVEQFAWSPDGNTIAFVTPDNPRVSAKARREHHDLFSIHDDDYQSTHAPAPSHIWVLSIKDGAARQLTRGPTSVLENPPPFAGSITAPAWSADGKWLVFTRQIDADDSDTDKTTIAAVNVATGAVHAVTAHRTYEYTPKFAPEGDAIAYLYPHGPGPVSDMDVFVTSAAGGNARDVSADMNRDVYADYAWLPDARGVVAVVDDHVGTRIFVQPLRGAAHALALGSLNPLLVAVSAQGALAFVADSATRAPELYLLRTLRSQPVALTSFNRAFLAYAYPRSIEVTWHASDGQLDDGILTYPDDYKAGQHYPLVVYSHGGPEAASTGHFDGGEIGPLRDLFAAHGYLVFEPNYRGSDNLGDAHEHAIYRDPGIGPNSDVISGITMLEQQGIVDSARIAAVGHSYGGYMTTWLIAHQHFWRCAVVADGAVDWTQEYELAGDGNLAWTRDSLGGSPWDPQSAALYRTGSPITYAGQITTPTLILSGTADITVPISESFALYHALASRHIPVTFLGIPGAHHSPQDPVHRELYYRAIYDWVAARMQPSHQHG